MVQSLSYVLTGQTPGQYYRHSGRMTMHGPLIAVLVGLPAAIVLGVIYAYADIYIPLIYANVLLALGFGVAMGWLCGVVLKWGKVRNVPVALAIIGSLTFVAYYVCWAAWEYGVISRGGVEFPALFIPSHPTFMWELAQDINADGTWSVGHAGSGGSNVSGAALWVV